MRSVPSSFDVFRQSTVRQPVFQVLAGSTEVDISEWTMSVEINETSENEASTASFRLASPEGKFDIFGTCSDSCLIWYNNPIKIKAGYGATLINMFVGYVTKASGLRYTVGGQEVVDVQCIDKSKPFIDQEITTHAYSGVSRNDIIAGSCGVFTFYGGLDAGDVSLPDAEMDEALPASVSLQFSEMSIMDIGYMVADSKLRALGFDYDGKLTTWSKELSAAPLATITGKYIESLEIEWDDSGTFSTARVIGGKAGEVKTLSDEQTLVNTDVNFIAQMLPYDQQYYFEYIPVDTSTVRWTFEGSGLDRGSSYIKDLTPEGCKFHLQNGVYTCWIGFGMWENIKGTLRIYGKVYEILDIIPIATYTDSDLASAYPQTEEYENDVIFTEEDALDVAQRLVTLSKWRRGRVSVEMLNDFRIRCGDTISFWSPRHSHYVKVYVNELTRSWEVGGAETLSIKGYYVGVAS